jgi:uncharacterized protein
MERRSSTFEGRIEHSPDARPSTPIARWTRLITGLLLFGLAIALMIRSEIGLGPWDAFHVGISRLTPLSVGLASIVTGVVIVIATLTIGIRPGTGTVANMVVIGVAIDLFLPSIPPAPSFAAGLATYLAAIVLCGFATGLYISAQMGHGPRDGLMIGLATRTRMSVGWIRTFIEISVLAAGWLMGGPVGIGTLIFAVCIGPAAQWGLKVFGLLPPRTIASRSVE